MSIHEHKKGHYTVQVFKADPLGGRPLRLCRRIAGRSAAEEQERVFIREAEAWGKDRAFKKEARARGILPANPAGGTQIPTSSVAFASYLENSYLPWFKATHPRTGMRILQARASSFLVVAEDLAGVPLNEVEYKVEELVQRWQEEGIRYRGSKDRRGRVLNRKSRPLTTAGINERLRRIREVLNHAYDKRVLDLPPRVKTLTVKGARPGAEKPIRYFSVEERVRFLKYANPDVADVFELARMTGMRPAEVFHARVDWVDLRQRKITVQACDCGLCPGGEWVTKTGRHRSVDIADPLMPLLRRLMRDKAGDALLVETKHGQPIMRLEGSSGRFKRTLRRAGLERKGLSFYSCRHTFAADLITAGTPLARVAALLGNSVQVCERYYGHLIPGHTAKDVEAAIKAIEPWGRAASPSRGSDGSGDGERRTPRRVQIPAAGLSPGAEKGSGPDVDESADEGPTAEGLPNRRAA
jgi:integrase